MKSLCVSLKEVDRRLHAGAENDEPAASCTGGAGLAGARTGDVGPGGVGGCGLVA